MVCGFVSWLVLSRGAGSAPLLWGKEGPGQFASGAGSAGAEQLQLLVGVLLPVGLGFARLSRGRGVGRVCYRGQAVGYGHGTWHDPFHCRWETSRGQAHYTWGVPANQREGGKTGKD